jgi:hypothetical protein
LDQSIQVELEILIVLLVDTLPIRYPTISRCSPRHSLQGG